MSGEDDRALRRRALLLGADAESLVAHLLTDEGWTILDRNWLAERGELDLVARRDGCVRFVEVKARHADDPLADEAVTPVKQQRLRRAAEAWMYTHAALGWTEVAFLVAWVDTTTAPWEVRWLDDAFDG